MPSTHRISIPGFEAEAALTDNGSYATRRTRGDSSASVVPQVLIWGPGDCIPNCVCVKAEGCPCCGYQDMLPWQTGTLDPISFVR